MMADYSNSNAAKKRRCCVCGKYCCEDEYYFPEVVMCGNCYRLQDYRKLKKYMLIPVSSYS